MYLDALQFEFNPFQLGSITPGNVGYLNTSLFGTKYLGGSPFDSNKCWHGDTLFWITGLSSSAFEETVLFHSCKSKIFQPGQLIKFLDSRCEKEFPNSQWEQYICNITVELLVAAIQEECPGGRVCPGTFNNFLRNIPSIQTDRLKYNETIDLIDGGYGGNLPIAPLLTKNLDIIIAVDSSYDTAEDAPEGRPDGEALIIASKYAKKYGYPFPSIPTNNSDPVAKMSIFPRYLLGKTVRDSSIFLIVQGIFRSM
jgi:hypothetical protein